MISINDYDTGFKIDSKLIGKLRSKITILIDQLNSVPIFFVKENTMDGHCLSECLERDCTKETVRNFETGDFRPAKVHHAEEIMKKLENCMRKCNALGCYIPNADDISEKPHILLCPERIRYRNKNQFNDLLMEVLIHELTHAYFSTGIGLNDISKHIIEESLCEAYAFSKLGKNEEIFEFMADHKRPPEYTAFKFWTELSTQFPLIIPMSDWKNKDYKSFSSLTQLFYYGGFPILNSGYLDVIAMTILSFS